jgi:hypothetical protein
MGLSESGGGSNRPRRMTSTKKNIEDSSTLSATLGLETVGPGCRV